MADKDQTLPFISPSKTPIKKYRVKFRTAVSKLVSKNPTREYTIQAKDRIKGNILPVFL
jgi:hypothetical protein